GAVRVAAVVGVDPDVGAVVAHVPDAVGGVGRCRVCVPVVGVKMAVYLVDDAVVDQAAAGQVVVHLAGQVEGRAVRHHEAGNTKAPVVGPVAGPGQVHRAGSVDMAVDEGQRTDGDVVVDVERAVVDN